MAEKVKTNYILYIVLLIGMGFFAYYLYFAVSWIAYPNSLDYGEGFVMNYAKLWANGTWKWDINVPPYLTMVYGVGYPILIEPLIKVFGTQLWLGRVISFISALATCGFLFLIVRNLTRNNWYALIAGLLPATQPIFRDWSAMARVDMPAVMFDIVGFYLVVRFRKTKWVYLSLIPFVIAIAIKLTAISGLLAFLVYLLITNRQRLWKYALILSGGVALIVAPLMITSNGEYWKHIVLYQNSIENFDIPVFMVNWQMFFYAFIPLFALSLMYIKRKRTLIGVFIIVAIAFDMITTFRAGAAGMYYYEAIMAGSIGTALGFYYLRRKPQTAMMFIIGMVVFLVIFNSKSNMSLPDGQYAKDVAIVQNMISNTDKPIPTENAVLVMDAQKEIPIELFIFTNLSRLGYWNDSEYLGQYNSQYFDYVLLKVSLDQKKKYESMGFPDSNFTSEVMEAIGKNYTLVFSNERGYDNPKEDWRTYLCLYEANRMVKR